MYASLSDIQTHLPSDTFNVDESDVAEHRADAERIVKANLLGTFTSVIIAAWGAPDDTPDLVRAITGRLIAAKVYMKLMSREVDDWTDRSYPQRLYNEAMQLLSDIKTGRAILEEVTGDSQPQSFNNTMFTPNDASTPAVFSMGLEL